MHSFQFVGNKQQTSIDYHMELWNSYIHKSNLQWNITIQMIIWISQLFILKLEEVTHDILSDIVYSSIQISKCKFKESILSTKWITKKHINPSFVIDYFQTKVNFLSYPTPSIDFLRNIYIYFHQRISHILMFIFLYLLHNPSKSNHN